MRGVQIFGIGTGVSPVVGFAETYEKQARLFYLEIFDGGVEGHGVEGFIGPDADGFGFQRIDQGKFRRGSDGGERFVAGIDQEAAALAIEDTVERLPMRRRLPLCR